MTRCIDSLIWLVGVDGVWSFEINTCVSTCRFTPCLVFVGAEFVVCEFMMQELLVCEIVVQGGWWSMWFVVVVVTIVLHGGEWRRWRMVSIIDYLVFHNWLFKKIVSINWCCDCVNRLWDVLCINNQLSCMNNLLRGASNRLCVFYVHISWFGRWFKLGVLGCSPGCPRWCIDDGPGQVWLSCFPLNELQIFNNIFLCLNRCL